MKRTLHRKRIAAMKSRAKKAAFAAAIKAAMRLEPAEILTVGSVVPPVRDHL